MKLLNTKLGFTLAEVLITLAIVGVVAALTIPTLVANINSKVTENQNKVFQSKLIKGLNLAKTAGDINNTYTSTEDFLRNGLAKHYKMSAICGANELRNCIPYDTIKYVSGEEEKTVNVSKIKTASSLKLKEPFTDIAAFVSMDGIPAIVSYNKNCVVDTEMLDKNISSCLAGVYDLNGAKLPNKYGVILDGDKISSYTNDIHAFNGAKFGDPSNVINGVTIAVQMFNPGDPAIYNKVGGGSNYWLIAKKYCESQGASLPSVEQLALIARKLYNDSSISTDHSSMDYRAEYGQEWNNSPYKEEVIEILGADSFTSYTQYNHFTLWADSSANDYFTGEYVSGLDGSVCWTFDEGDGMGGPGNCMEWSTSFHAICVN